MTDAAAGGIQVIGVGLPRTGTRTLAKALDILGFPCVHQLGDVWDFGLEEVTTLLEDREFHIPGTIFKAVVEAKYWRRLLSAHPTAKVILTVRNHEEWYRSMARHTDRIHARLENPDPLRMEQAAETHCMLFGSRWPVKTLWIERAWQHEFAVRRWCREKKRRLLVFDPTKGRWGRLPQFLDCAVPAEDFPWMNKCREDVELAVIRQWELHQEDVPAPEPETNEEGKEPDDAVHPVHDLRDLGPVPPVEGACVLPVRDGEGTEEGEDAE